MGKFSREKGRRGELNIAHKLGGKRVGVAFASTPVDVVTDFADYQVKAYAVGSGTILECLEAMSRQPDAVKPRFVVFKPKRGQWLVACTLEQHIELHGDGKRDMSVSTVGTGEGRMP